VSVSALVAWLVLLVRVVAGEAWVSADMERLVIAGRQDDGVSGVVDIVVIAAIQDSGLDSLECRWGMLVQSCAVVAALDTDSPFRQDSYLSGAKRIVVVLVLLEVMGGEAEENCIVLPEVSAVAARQLPFDPALEVAGVVLEFPAWVRAFSAPSANRIQVVTGAQVVV